MPRRSAVTAETCQRGGSTQGASARAVDRDSLVDALVGKVYAGRPSDLVLTDELGDGAHRPEVLVRRQRDVAKLGVVGGEAEQRHLSWGVDTRHPGAFVARVTRKHV